MFDELNPSIKTMKNYDLAEIWRSVQPTLLPEHVDAVEVVHLESELVQLEARLCLRCGHGGGGEDRGLGGAGQHLLTAAEQTAGSADGICHCCHPTRELELGLCRSSHCPARSLACRACILSRAARQATRSLARSARRAASAVLNCCSS